MSMIFGVFCLLSSLLVPSDRQAGLGLSFCITCVGGVCYEKNVWHKRSSEGMSCCFF